MSLSGKTCAQWEKQQSTDFSIHSFTHQILYIHICQHFHVPYKDISSVLTVLYSISKWSAILFTKGEKKDSECLQSSGIYSKLIWRKLAAPLTLWFWQQSLENVICNYVWNQFLLYFFHPQKLPAVWTHIICGNKYGRLSCLQLSNHVVPLKSARAPELLKALYMRCFSVYI